MYSITITNQDNGLEITRNYHEAAIEPEFIGEQVAEMKEILENNF